MKLTRLILMLGLTFASLAIGIGLTLWFVTRSPTNNASKVSLGCKPRPALIKSELVHYPFHTVLDRCDGSCNTIENPYSRECLPESVERKSIEFYNMLHMKNETKPMINHKTCECKCRFDSSDCNPEQEWKDCRCVDT